MEAARQSGDNARPPRVAAFLQCTNLGGMEKVAYSLFEQLQQRSLRIKVLTARTWGPGKPRVLGVDPEAQAFNYRGKFGWRSFPAFWRHARAVCRGSDKLWVIGHCTSCLVAARLAGKKAIMSHHYHHFEGRWSRLRWTAFYLAFGSGLEAITYPTEFTRNEAVRIAPWLRNKMRVVHNTFDVSYNDEARRIEARESARKALGIATDAFVVGNGGWLIPRKRFDVFLRTAHAVVRRIPNAEFHICGGGPEETRLRQLAAELGIQERVHFRGWVEDLTRYYQAWDVLLFNTDLDALGCTPLEAASHGCLCVASCRYGGLPEFIKQGETGFILSDHDSEKLADFIAQLARDPEQALRIRRQAADRLRQEFNHEQALNFYATYFHSTPAR